MSCCLKNYAKKTIVLTPLTPLTPLTSELAKLELIMRNRSVLCRRFRLRNRYRLEIFKKQKVYWSFQDFFVLLHT